MTILERPMNDYELSELDKNISIEKHIIDYYTFYNTDCPYYIVKFLSEFYDENNKPIKALNVIIKHELGFYYCVIDVTNFKYKDIPIGTPSIINFEQLSKNDIIFFSFFENTNNQKYTLKTYKTNIPKPQNNANTAVLMIDLFNKLKSHSDIQVVNLNYCYNSDVFNLLGITLPPKEDYLSETFSKEI